MWPFTAEKFDEGSQKQHVRLATPSVKESHKKQSISSEEGADVNPSKKKMDEYRSASLPACQQRLQEARSA